MIKIEILDKSRYPEYENFLLSNEHSLFYHSTKYKDFLEDLLSCESRYLLAYDKERIVAALPLMIKDGPFGKVVNSLPYYGSNGGILGDNVSEEVLEALKIEFNLLDCVSSTLVSSPTHDNIVWLTETVTDQRISQITPLNPGVLDKKQYLLSIIESSTKRNISKAKREGIRISVKNEQALSFLETTHKENMLVIGGKAKSQEFFQKIPKYFMENNDYKVYVAEKDGKNIAGLLVFYFNRTVEYYTPVIDHNYRDQQPLAAIIFEAMEDAMNDDCIFWNWGGTWLTQGGVYKFKKKWGSLERVYNYSTRVRNNKIFDAKLDVLSNDYEGFYLYNYHNKEKSK